MFSSTNMCLFLWNRLPQKYNFPIFLKWSFHLLTWLFHNITNHFLNFGEIVVIRFLFPDIKKLGCDLFTCSTFLLFFLCISFSVQSHFSLHILLCKIFDIINIFSFAPVINSFAWSLALYYFFTFVERSRKICLCNNPCISTCVSLSIGASTGWSVILMTYEQKRMDMYIRISAIQAGW